MNAWVFAVIGVVVFFGSIGAAFAIAHLEWWLHDRARRRRAGRVHQVDLCGARQS